MGMILGYIILTSCYYANVFQGRDLKFMSTSLFSRQTTEVYDQSAVITSEYTLDRDALETVGLPRYTTTYAISQLSYNLSLGSAITYILLWHWKELKDGQSLSNYIVNLFFAERLLAFGGMRFLKGNNDIDDPHYKRSFALLLCCPNHDRAYTEMKKYPEVPQWVYGSLFLVCLALSIGLSYAGPKGVVLIPAWSILFLVCAFSLSLPSAH